MTVRAEEQSGKPDKKVYAITPKGMDTLARAISVLPARDKYKSEFLFQMLLQQYITPDVMLAAIDKQLTDLRHDLARIAECRCSEQPHAGARFVADYGEAVLTAAVSVPERKESASLLRQTDGAGRRIADWERRHMIRRIFYLLLVTVLLGGLAGAIAFYAFDFKPKMLATVILGAPRPPETVSAEPARTDTWQPQISAIGTLDGLPGHRHHAAGGRRGAREINFESGAGRQEGRASGEARHRDRGSGHPQHRGRTRQQRDRADAPRGARLARASWPAPNSTR